MNPEQQRLSDTARGKANWKFFGPYLSERQWGTVREDYSPDGAAWDYFPHDHARSRAYRWGEDGIAGISDDEGRLCLALALWNGRDPILKERLFGLTNAEGNHGEDVKELYYYLDATPTHSYLEMLYKYPQREFPYAQLVEENARRKADSRLPEFELLDTGIFDDDRYWDVFVEYALAAPEDVLMRVTVHNRGPETAMIHLLPQLWFRNTWSWKSNSPKPILRLAGDGGLVAEHAELGEYRIWFCPPHESQPAQSWKGPLTPTLSPSEGERVPKAGEGAVQGFNARIPSEDSRPGPFPPDGRGNRSERASKPGASANFSSSVENLSLSHPMGEGRGEGPELLFCDNETNVRRHFGWNDAAGFFKDAFHEYIVRGVRTAVNPRRTGTKAGLLYKLVVPAGESACVRLRLSSVGQASSLSQTANEAGGPIPEMVQRETGIQRQAGSLSYKEDFDAIFNQRLREADEYYADLQRDIADPDARNVQRQGLAGMIWSKQYFYYDVREWLNGDPAQPPPPAPRKQGRNRDWIHLNNASVMSMPDKWEYPWYAAWDLAFHCIPLALVDSEFAKQQLSQLTREWYMHPNGQFPACEWAFGDVNPPVHAWATWRVFQMDRKERRRQNPGDPGDVEFLERVYHKLLLNFTWWVNRKDAQGRNIFQGGFLGLDNIGVFDRSAPLPTGGFINQADGTSWMAMYCLNLMRIALELALHNRVYEDIATKFFEHFLDIAAAINGAEDGMGLWSEQDEFYYDELRTPGGREITLQVRSMVGLIPLFAVEVLDPSLLKKLPDFDDRMHWYLRFRPELAKLVSRWSECGMGERHLLSLLRGHRMKCLLRRALDESEFLSDYGVRALSKVHEREPYRLQCGGMTHEVAYWPAESRNGLFGGNSNWRGPVWMPVNYLLLESLQKFHHYYGDDFKVECPAGSGKMVALNEVANELSRRLTSLFLKGPDGQRPVLKQHPKLATDPHFRDYLLFHEYFHGDTGRGVGASHQTGWTGLVAKLLQPRRTAPMTATSRPPTATQHAPKTAMTPAGN